MITFSKYQRLLRDSEKRSSSDDYDVERFQASQPKACPKCGCQVFDPFGFGRVIHDVTHKSKRAAAMPNDQELSHATRDFRTAEIRSAQLKAPIALAPVMC